MKQVHMTMLSKVVATSSPPYSLIAATLGTRPNTASATALASKKFMSDSFHRIINISLHSTSKTRFTAATPSLKFSQTSI